MELFDYFTRLFGMDPTQLPVYLRVMTFIVPVAIVIYVICLIVRIVRKSVKAIRHIRLGIRTKEDASLSADSIRGKTLPTAICWDVLYGMGTAI